MNTISAVRPATILVAILILISGSCKKHEPRPGPYPGSKEVKLGAILDLTGDYSEEGMAGQAAIELAISDLNGRYASVNSPVRFTCTYADTHMDTVKTLKYAKEMYGQGFRLLVGGPGNSTELKAIRNFLNDNRMLALTCFSSSPSLAVPGDYIFRLITDDLVQGRALIRMMATDSIKALIPIWRKDTYGTGLFNTVKERFEAMGGKVYDGAGYAPDATDFSALIVHAAGDISAAIALYGAEKVGVILISYQEASGFLQAASVIPDLASVKWYGCDANVQKSSVTENSGAAQFAFNVRFLAPIMAIGTADSMPATARKIAGRIKAVTGKEPDAYALSAYDAVMIYGQCYDIVQRYDATAIQSVLSSVCASYNYMGISRALNEAGDLSTANYIFWTVNPSGSGWAWESYSTWFSDGDYIKVRSQKSEVRR
jgi:branched-chain amino acid transport system substrate-binding protein